MEPGAPGGRLASGRRRGAGEIPAGLRIEFEGDPGGPFEIASLDPSILNVAELDLPEGVDRLILTGLGPGEARLTMACLTPLD